MKLIVNGQSYEHRGNGTLEDLLVEMAVQPERIAVVVNEQVVPAPHRKNLRLNEGDRVDVFTFASGG